MYGEQSLLQCCRRRWNTTGVLAWNMYGRYLGVPPVCQMLGRSVAFSAPSNVPFNFYALANLIFADNDGFMYQCPTNSSNWCCYSTVLNNTCNCDTGAHVLQLGPPGGVVKAPQIQATASLGWIPTSTSTNITSRKKSWNMGKTIGVVIGCLFVGLVAIGSVLFFLRRLQRKNRQKKAQGSAASSEESAPSLDVGDPNGIGIATFAMPANAIVE
jgi:hypothetical protein